PPEYFRRLRFCLAGSVDGRFVGACSAIDRGAVAGRAEPFGLDPVGLVAKRYEITCGALDECSGTAHVRERTRIRGPRDLAQQLGIDAAMISRPSLRLLARESVDHLDSVAGELIQLVAEYDLSLRAHRVQQPDRSVAHHRGVLAHDAAQWHDAR